MKAYVIVLCLACLLPAQNAGAAIGFPWLFHTRPRPILLDPAPVGTAKLSHSVVWHGKEMYPPSSGRLYFKDSIDQIRTQRVKSRSSDRVRISRTLLGK